MSIRVIPNQHIQEVSSLQCNFFEHQVGSADFSSELKIKRL